MASSTEMALFEVTMSSAGDYGADNYDHKLKLNSTDDYYYYGPSENELLPMSHVYIPVLYYIMFFVGFSGNLFVIVVIGNRHKRNGRLVDTFVLNLAIADLVFVLTLPLWAVAAGHHEWPFGEALCKISSFIITVNRFSNIFFLTCMSVDRYLAVVKRMDSQFLRSSNCAQITCGIVWIVSFLLGIPSLVYRGMDVTVCSEDSKSSFVQAMNLLTIFLTFILPVMILGLCYGSIMVNLRRNCHAAASSRAGARRRHSLKIVFTIISAFLISWLPFNVFKSIQVFLLISRGEMNDETIMHIYRGLTLSCCLAFLNSCVNPAIYLFLDQHFRHRVYVLCLTCLSQGDTHQSYISSHSFSNGTTETYSGNMSSRGRLFSLTQKE
ncbi:probable G-protein coupled receptor 25 [Xyrauchen texanus]|uniref:probable G-protein coupled receptor 25 n=1 Tax=Xyrauchen texanus TaxID=154827 RepID=UPI002241F181|nr:probable G-protein coupled receptor 25 [Xyrauchen texanus]